MGNNQTYYKQHRNHDTLSQSGIDYEGAVKITTVEAFKDLVQRFIKEAEASESTNHPLGELALALSHGVDHKQELR